MHALIMLIICLVSVCFTLGYIFFSKVDKSENNVFVGLSNTNKYYVSKTLHKAHQPARFKGNHKRYEE